MIPSFYFIFFLFPENKYTTTPLQKNFFFFFIETGTTWMKNSIVDHPAPLRITYYTLSISRLGGIGSKSASSTIAYQLLWF